MPRIVVLGCGTAVGKTRLSLALLRGLARAGQSCIGLKPIESGIEPVVSGRRPARPSPGSDARALADASSLPLTTDPHPLYAFSQPISPHLAARHIGVEITFDAIARWVRDAEQSMTPLVGSHMALWSIIESAGGVFTPLSSSETNLDLARALDPAIWILVAGDSLGVLHEVGATLEAMRSRGRVPEHVVLSAAREPDASTGTNAGELDALGIVRPSAVLERNDDRGVEGLVRRLLAEALGRT